jgi:hypothetical protein
VKLTLIFDGFFPNVYLAFFCRCLSPFRTIFWVLVYTCNIGLFFVYTLLWKPQKRLLRSYKVRHGATYKLALVVSIAHHDVVGYY